MKKGTFEIILSGVGGQGLVSCGSLLGEAASLSGLNAVMTTSYGVETRGTFVKSDLIVSTEYIDYPEALQPDIILTLSPEAYRYYAPIARKEALLIFDDSKITPASSKAQQIGFPISNMAESMGNIASANILSIGIILAKTLMFEPQFLEKVIRKRFDKTPAALEKNLAILNKGFEMAHE